MSLVETKNDKAEVDQHELHVVIRVTPELPVSQTTVSSSTLTEQAMPKEQMEADLHRLHDVIRVAPELPVSQTTVSSSTLTEQAMPKEHRSTKSTIASILEEMEYLKKRTSYKTNKDCAGKSIDIAGLCSRLAF